MHNRKLYLARFRHKFKDLEFYKVGQCWQYDANERFLFESSQYDDFDIKIMTSAWGPEDEVDQWEQRFLKIKDKDFWLPNKFSGITEIRKFNQAELTYLFAQFNRLSSKWYEQRRATV